TSSSLGGGASSGGGGGSEVTAITTTVPLLAACATLCLHERRHSEEDASVDDSGRGGSMEDLRQQKQQQAAAAACGVQTKARRIRRWLVAGRPTVSHLFKAAIEYNSKMLVVLTSLLLLLSSTLSSQQSTKVGAIIRIRLSNYSNPHQVLSETGMPCEQNRGLCDPVFHVKLGTQGYSFEQSRNSNVFDNVVSLNGEFFTAEFRLLQELPDLLLIRVKIEDNDAFDPVPQTIGEITEEFHRLLPSVPTRWNNSVTKELFFTPINKYVSLTLTINVQCLPGLYGRRCSTQCTGEPVYPSCQRGDTRCEKSLDFDHTAAGVAVIVIGLLGLSLCVVKGVNKSSSAGEIRPQQQQQQQQQLLSNSASLSKRSFLPPTARQTARYKNPVYHQQQQAGHTEEEVYEEVEEPRDGKEAPPLPPKDADFIGDSVDAQLLSVWAQCPAPFNIEAGKCVFVNTAQSFSWCEANRQCAMIGGELLNSYSSLYLLGSMPSMNCDCRLWLGVTDLADERGSSRSGWQIINSNDIVPLNDSIWVASTEPNRGVLENCMLQTAGSGAGKLGNNPVLNSPWLRLHVLYNSKLRACRLLLFTDAQVEAEIETSADWVKFSVFLSNF
uniref:C-type lectin domain-containing protein n=1 Tax=Macrostomum lignano TaxID=282301 RepID=A0A1I8FT22_9PLAT